MITIVLRMMRQIWMIGMPDMNDISSMYEDNPYLYEEDKRYMYNDIPDMYKWYTRYVRWYARYVQWYDMNVWISRTCMLPRYRGWPLKKLWGLELSLFKKLSAVNDNLVSYEKDCKGTYLIGKKTSALSDHNFCWPKLMLTFFIPTNRPTILQVPAGFSKTAY